MGLRNYSVSYSFSEVTGWTQAIGGTGEYYLATDVKHKPFVVEADGTRLSEGTLGSLNVGEWAWGDGDSLGFDTIYVRITADADPDTAAMRASLAALMAEVPADKALGVISMEAMSRETEEDAVRNVAFIRSDNSDNELFDPPMSIRPNDYNVLEHGVSLTAGQKLKFMSDSELVKAFVSANEVDA